MIVKDTVVTKNKKVLIVDDTPTNLDLLKGILEPQGYKLYFATTGDATLKLAPRVKPDLILLDVMMPGIDGFETCKQLKSLPGTENIPVIFITARSETEDITMGFNVGAVDYITKPIKPAEVGARVRTHLQISTLMKSQSSIIRTLDNANKSKSDGIATMGHELRTPLNSIIGFADLIRDELSAKDAGEQFDSVYESIDSLNASANYLLRLINNVLSMAKLDAGMMTLNLEDYVISDILRDIESSVAPLVKANQNSLQVDIRTPDTIGTVDITKLQQILYNLIGNACKFTHNGNIKLIHYLKDDKLIFEIEDTGIGMNEAQLQYIFNPYEQADISTEVQYGGTGLGLSISRRLAEMMEGSLTAHSRLNEGSTFILNLPASY